MNKKLLLSLLFGCAAIGATAETTAWGYLGTSILRTNIFGKGEYESFERVIVKMHPDSIGCYITDASAFNAEYNGEPIAPIPLFKDENGYAREFMFVIENFNEGENILRFQRRLPYINKNSENLETRYTATTSSIHTIRFRVTEHTTLESADAIKDAALASHKEVITYPWGNEPGEYDYLLGDYGFSLNNRYNRYYREVDDQIKPYVIDADGNTVAYCANKINRSNVYLDEDVTFHITINSPITTPGEYWIVYPSAGNYRYYTGTSNNLHHFSNFKIGPYIVKESSDNIPEADEPEIEWLSPSEFTSDFLPDSIYFNVSNAAVIGRHTNGKSVDVYGIHITYQGQDLNIGSIMTSGKNGIAVALPAGWYRGAGEYTLSITRPADILEAMSIDGSRMKFSEDEPIETTFTVADPTLPESLDFYVRSACATSYEIAEDETVNVRLMHPDQNLGMKIYVKWTGEQPSQQIMAKGAEEFQEHDGDLEVSSPGRLDYYTSRGGVTSPVKTINFIRTDDTTTGVETLELLSIPTEEGLYNLSGIRVGENPQPGLYIRRLSDGTARKVIVR